MVVFVTINNQIMCKRYFIPLNITVNLQVYILHTYIWYTYKHNLFKFQQIYSNLHYTDNRQQLDVKFSIIAINSGPYK